MRVYRSLFLVLHLSLVVILADGKSKSSTGGQKLTFGQLSTMDLESVGSDGDILFDMEWPGAEAKEQAIQSIVDSRKPGGGDDGASDGSGEGMKVLPASFLEESYSDSEIITMTTIDQEQYTCVLPDLTGGSAPKDMDESSEGASPRSLLKSLRRMCTKLLMGYWTYELCHSKFVRQYHEEQVEKGKFKIDEYYLGKMKVDNLKEDTGKQHNHNMEDDDDDDDTIEDGKLSDSERPPTFYFTGKTYAYHEVEMEAGTLCDISNEPRSIRIKYICDMDAHQSGTFLHIAEVTTCKYEAVVSTRQLCVNKYFRLKENPRRTINCYPEGDAPRRPTILLEHELSLKQFYPKSSKGTKEGLSLLSGVPGTYEDFDPQESFEKQIAKGLPPDEQFLVSFLSGDSCLRGGSGWWLHEICYGKYVRQVHEDSNGRVEVYLGYWSESDHRTWFERTGRRRQSKLQVTHLYTKGDVCDVTGASRQCQVKFKCVKTTKASQVTIFLEEPTTCSYTLTVEASFLCPLLEKTNDIGMIILPHSDTLTSPTDTEPQTAPSDTKSSSRSGKSQNMMSSAADSTNLRQDFHSDRSQPTTQEGKASRHGTSNEQEATRSQTNSQEPTPHQDLETHTPQDGAPSISAEQSRSSSEDKQRDGATRNQAPPPSEIRKPRKESSVRKKQGNPPSGTVTASQSTVPQSQDQREPQETKQGHSTLARDFDDDGHQTQDQTSTERGRGAEWDRDGGARGRREKDHDESATAGSRDEPSNTKNDATSHRL